MNTDKSDNSFHKWILETYFLKKLFISENDFFISSVDCRRDTSVKEYWILPYKKRANITKNIRDEENS